MEKITQIENQDKHKESLVRQGEMASEVFSGKYKFWATKEMYEESAELISGIIKKMLPANHGGGIYEFADLGSFKGELMSNIIAELLEYDFHTTAVDINETALKENNADEKIVAKLEHLPLQDSSQDVVNMRYVLQWNSPEQQKEILREISRVTRGVAIVQHAGADNENSNDWREKLDDLFDGDEISKLKREGHFFSSRIEIENWMQENNINFERFEEKRVDGFSDIFTERFNLDKNDSETMKKILGDKDYIIQTTWIIYPNKKD